MERERSTIRILNKLTSVSLDNFEDRLKLQKLVYLARKMGYNLGYSFSWYARGPYSPSLTRMLFSANDHNLLVLDEAHLNDEETKIVYRLRKFLQDDIEKPKMLELLASIWYFLREKSYTHNEKNKLIDVIVRKKSKYNREEVKKAFNRIQRFING